MQNVVEATAQPSVAERKVPEKFVGGKWMNDTGTAISEKRKLRRRALYNRAHTRLNERWLFDEPRMLAGSRPKQKKGWVY